MEEGLSAAVARWWIERRLLGLRRLLPELVPLGRLTDLVGNLYIKNGGDMYS